MTESARFWNKHLTITSLDAESPVTLERGEPFASVRDLARGGYNGAPDRGGRLMVPSGILPYT